MCPYNCPKGNIDKSISSRHYWKIFNQNLILKKTKKKKKPLFSTKNESRELIWFTNNLLYYDGGSGCGNSSTQSVSWFLPFFNRSKNWDSPDNVACSVFWRTWRKEGFQFALVLSFARYWKAFCLLISINQEIFINFLNRFPNHC